LTAEKDAKKSQKLADEVKKREAYAEKLAAAETPAEEATEEVVTETPAEEVMEAPVEETAPEATEETAPEAE
jgi:hypothetical protein